MTGRPTGSDQGLRQAGWFFLLVLALSVPFWLAGSVGDRLLPASVPIQLPTSALMAFMPMVAAMILVARAHGRAGLRTLLGGLFGAGRPPLRWLLAALLLMPGVLLLEYGLITVTSGPIPGALPPLPLLPVFLAMFFVSAIGEELGWQGYAFGRLETRWSALGAALALGVFWALWHVVPLIQTGHDAGWIFWQCAAMIPLRIITVWLFASADRSLLVAVLFHMMTNVSEFMFPTYGSHYDPAITCALLTVVAAVVVWLWGPKTLARYRFARR